MKSIWRNIIIASSFMIICCVLMFLPVFFGPSFRHTKVTNTILIDSDDDFIKNKFPGSGTDNDPYIIENHTFGVNETFVRDVYVGLEIKNTNKHFVVRNCTFFGGLVSLKISNIAKGTALICNNKFYSLVQAEWDNLRGDSGINIKNSSHVIIRDNFFNCIDRFYNDKYYIGYGGIVYVTESDNLVIEGNSFREHYLKIINSNNSSLCFNQIEIFDVPGPYFEDSPYSKISDNKIIFHYSYSTFIIEKSSYSFIENNIVELEDSGNGILVLESNHLSITNNSIIRDVFDPEKSGVGILLSESSYNLIHLNVIRYFLTYGISLRINSNNNIIFHNSLYNNTLSTFQSQGNDESYGNIWYNFHINEGNYWNDLGSNSTYVIAGTAGSVDLFPLSEPITV